MSAEHPITPPPELVQQWMRVNNMDIAPLHLAQALATQAARWGADQELEACVGWLNNTDVDDSQEAAKDLRAARRPKPPSLKEQALAKLPEHPENMASHLKLTPGEVATIRRALEALPDD